MIMNAAQRRKEARDLIELIQPETRYRDLCMLIRRPMALFTVPVKVGTYLHAGGVAFTVLSDATPGVPVPVAGVIRGESRRVPDHAPLTLEDGTTVGEFSPEIMIRAGGRWDFFARAWSDQDPAQIVVFDITEAQLDLTRWFRGWMARYKARQLDPRLARIEDPDFDYSILVALSGRRAGKSAMSVVLAFALAVDLPCVHASETLVWLTAVAHSERDELDREVRDWIPSDWFSYQKWPRHEYTLLHGSKITNVSADDPETLKRGRADLIILNELAKMDQAALNNAVGAVSDRGGLVLGTTNPPRRQRGAYVKKIHDRFEEARAQHETYPIKVIKLDHALNTAIDQRARTRVGRALAELDPKLAAADDAGLVLSIDDLIFYAYDHLRHGLSSPPDDLPDITEQITKAIYGRAFPWIASVDFQDQPYICASFAKVYGTMDRPIVWFMGEIWNKGSEPEFLDKVTDEGFYLARAPKKIAQEVDPGTVLWIADASGQWQNRKDRSAATRVDPVSFVAFKNYGMFIAPPTVKRSKEGKYSANPDRDLSFAQVNEWLAQDRVRVVSAVAKKTAGALKECVAKQVGKEIRPAGEYSHWADCIRYLLWYLDPPTVRKAKGKGMAPSVPMQAYTV